jgi:UDP-3-O-[3-hydroxymyristoyl] glucosamine N-acyltransferase
MACAAIVNEDISIEPGKNRAFIKVKNADLAMSQVLELFEPPTPLFAVDIHPTANIDATAILENGVRIGAGSYIGPKVQIGENATILGQSGVTKNIPEGAEYFGTPAGPVKHKFKELAYLRNQANIER